MRVRVCDCFIHLAFSDVHSFVRCPLQMFAGFMCISFFFSLVHRISLARTHCHRRNDRHAMATTNTIYKCVQSAAHRPTAPVTSANEFQRESKKFNEMGNNGKAHAARCPIQRQSKGGRAGSPGDARALHDALNENDWAVNEMP